MQSSLSNMEHKILSKHKNQFLNREEIKMEMNAESSPSVEAVKEALGKSKDLVVVKNITSNFGTHSFTADLVVYDSVESKERIEVIPRKVRKKLLEEKKKSAAEAKAKAAAEAAKPAEAPKQ